MPQPRPFRLAPWTLALALLASACTTRDPEPMPPTPQGPLFTGPREVSLVIPSAPSYADPGPMAPFDRKVSAAAYEAGARHLTYDPCLARAATEFGRHVLPDAKGKMVLPRALQEVVLHRAGCTDGWVSSHLMMLGTDDETEFWTHLRAILKDTSSLTHLGAGRAKAQAPFRWAYVVFLATREAELAPLPRALSPGELLTVQGKLLGDLASPKVLWLEPGGQVQTLDTLAQGQNFRAQVSVGRQVGEHWVEVLGTGSQGPRVAALFPVYVGVEPPSKVRLEPPPDESKLRTREEAESLMLHLVNQERARFGLAPLSRDERLVAVARKHSEDMRDRRYFAHTSPDGQSLPDRLAAADYPARQMAENLSQGPSVYDSVSGLMESLGHRENILNAELTHVGIGVAFGKDSYGGRTMYFTQNFSLPQRALSGAQFNDEVLARIAQARQHAQVEPLRQAPPLQDAAARYVRLSDPDAGGLDTGVLSDKIAQDLKAAGFSYQALYLQAQTVADPQDLQLPRELSQAHARALGLGAYPHKQGATTSWRVLLLVVE